MDMTNLLCKLTGKKEAIEANTKTLDVFKNQYNHGVLDTLNEIIGELEELTGITINEKNEHRKVVKMDQRARKVR